MLVATAFAGPLGPDPDDLGPVSGVSEEDLETAIPDGALDTGIAPAGCDFSHLRNGEQLPDQPTLFTISVPFATWGTPRLVDTLTEVAEEMRWRFPYGDPLTVGDMSRRGGGWLHGHRSHRGGLDADIGIYWGNANQYPQGLRVVAPGDMDLEANLALVQALFATGDVERILLDQRLIRALRRYAIDSGAMSEDDAKATFLLPGDPLSTSAWNLDQVVQHVPGHKHHFHVRVRCGD